MKRYIGCDAHRKYSIFVSLDENGKRARLCAWNTTGRSFANSCERSRPRAGGGGSQRRLVLVDERVGRGRPGATSGTRHGSEAADAGRNKTDELDAKGLATLLYDKRLPEVWIPPAKLLDLRGLMRTRLALRSYQSGIKNRILAAVNRYGLRGNDPSEKDWFNGKGRLHLNTWIMGLPEQTRMATIEEWHLADEMEDAIGKLEKQFAEKIGKIGYVRLLETMPRVGKILSATLYLEKGEVKRFPTAGHLASYAGLVPRVFSSGGKTHHGHVPQDANRYLKWAVVEAANCTVMHGWKYEKCHVGMLYQRLKAAKGHPKAAVAVARRLAEASWWILQKAQAYREPAPATMSSSKNG